MARGHQKFQSQQKNLKKQEELKKSKGSDQKAAAIKALTHKCSVCMVKFLCKSLFTIVNKYDVGFWLLTSLELELENSGMKYLLQALMPDPKTYKQHFQSKHPKAPIPPELVDVQA
ncbi:unnamed protein product [Litomosoides sigmodontis]|uniref:Small EDRK-rich factor-like N-terminal domain-containing protein n=1 Tax=Litomosoides sigmodontis TaxID=42156 RepID=A0A3P6TDM1_LITSI|nr:unnamed protein product [Litomosoides sigmodontis]